MANLLRNERQVIKAMILRLFILIGVILKASCLYADDIYVMHVDRSIIKIDNLGNQTLFAPSDPFASWVGGLAFDSKGNLYAANWSNNSIEKFDSAGNYSVFSKLNIRSPTGLAFDKKDNLFVSNLGNNMIMKFDSSGNGSLFGNLSSGPMGLAIDASDNLYVGVNVGSGIVKFDPSGNSTQFVNAGASNATGLAMGNDHNLYVGNPFAIVKFDSSGNSTVFANSSIACPVGLAVDSHNNFYLLDAFGSITKFDSSGNATLLVSGLKSPVSIAIKVQNTSPSPILVNVASPSNNSYVTNDTVVFIGTASSANGVTSVTLSSAGNKSDAVSVNAFTNWTASLSGLLPGTNLVNVVAKDGSAVANYTTNLVNVIYADTTFSSQGDSIPDSWKITHWGFGFLSYSNSNASADPDCDGMSNLAEFKTGTNPMNPEEYFHITSCQFDPTSESWVVQIPTVSQINYFFDWSSDLVTWSNISSQSFLGDGTVHSFTDIPPADSKRRFYRLRTP
jgi:sugar lactone lactonase YvrE